MQLACLHGTKTLKPCKHGMFACVITLIFNKFADLHVCKKVVTIEFLWVVNVNLTNIIII